MKKLLIATLVMLSATSSFAFTVNANVFFNRTVVTAEFQNNWNTPITCNGSAQGRTSSGNFYTSFLSPTIIYPGEFGNIYVYTNNYQPFVNARAFINCEFINY
jgi:hypothetical protein